MGRVLCAGLGPGEPDLMSVRSDRAIRSARHVAYFRKKGRPGQARRIVEGMLLPGVNEYAREYPLTTELPFDSPEYIACLAAFYDDWAQQLATLAQAEDVLVLCEGDPFFYGSFMHLYTRLQGRAALEVIPGIPGMVGCWWITGTPITWGDDVLTVLMATLPEADLLRHMQSADALVIMKTGRNLPKVRRARGGACSLATTRSDERRAGKACRSLRPAEQEGGECPYFAIVLVHGQGRRPEVLE